MSQSTRTAGGADRRGLPFPLFAAALAVLGTVLALLPVPILTGTVAAALVLALLVALLARPARPSRELPTVPERAPLVALAVGSARNDQRVRIQAIR